MPPTSTATVTNTATPVPTVTTTPLPTISGEENLFGSAESGSGALTIIDPVPLIPTYFSACLGSTDPNCEGGIAIYIGTDPGFEEAEEDIPGTLFALPDGVTVNLEVISIDSSLSLVFETGTLNAAGQSIELGTTPGIHGDLQWQLALPGDSSFNQGHAVTLKLTTTSEGFANSAEFTEVVKPSSPPNSD